ncbi:DNA-3-methyladenine glycosylase I [Antarcticirhabdus aurantiaca]|uniref:DNA-3-methyladenine glycosylase I n=1 Tax=Antarcticirhabdus aurantiaca TaxID=2606717 RepID=A0ACD4NLE5_9HYPH|nr:DNA-3-methyladenine glycosylase I [Antarcticirhabdus aurantiaca]WAJ27604.1 DNA-3-methyladenine glycosylase I [Jeongeuplla avenae]
MNETTDGLLRGEDGVARCFWCGTDPAYRHYHDREWGRPVADDDRLFEKLCLEGFQSGLSWATILRKRENFRRAFADFRIEAVAAMGEADVERLLGDPGIVRHRGKIVSTLNNARRAAALRERTGRSFAAFLWSFAPEPGERPEAVTLAWLRENPATPASTRLSKALKREGFTFVGPTTAYALMQGTGLVDDHMEGCAARAEAESARAAFEVPK